MLTIQTLSRLLLPTHTASCILLLNVFIPLHLHQIGPFGIRIYNKENIAVLLDANSDANQPLAS